MDIIEFSDKQKAIRLEQEKLRREFTLLLKRYKELDKQYGYNEYRELHNGLMDIKFGDFAKKFMEKLSLPFDIKDISATTKIGALEVEEKIRPVLHLYQSEIIFKLGDKFTFRAFIRSDKAEKFISETKEFSTVSLNTPENIEINKSNISLQMSECNYNFGKPFDPQKFVNKILKECFKDKVAQARANLYKPTGTPVEKTTTPSAQPATSVYSK